MRSGNEEDADYIQVFIFDNKGNILTQKLNAKAAAETIKRTYNKMAKIEFIEQKLGASAMDNKGIMEMIEKAPDFSIVIGDGNAWGQETLEPSIATVLRKGKFNPKAEYIFFSADQGTVDNMKEEVENIATENGVTLKEFAPNIGICLNKKVIDVCLDVAQVIKNKFKPHSHMVVTPMALDDIPPKKPTLK